MKKIIISSFFFVFICLSGYSQDLVITNTNDSINCKIAKVKGDIIFFTFINDDGKLINSLLPINKVIEYKYDYFQESTIPISSVLGDSNYPHFRIGISGGFSYLTSKVSDAIPAELVDYIKELKSGYHLSSDATYYLTKMYGIGLSYSLFKTSNTIPITIQDVYGNILHGNLSDDISINYIGPTFSTRFLNETNNNAFILAFSLGYMSYKNNATLIDDFELKGSTLGLVLGMDYDIVLTQDLMLGLGFSFTVGSLTKYTLKTSSYTQTIELQEGEYEGLSRINLSIGLYFVK